MDYSVRISFTGLSLWIDRGGFVDVLFPRAEQTGLEQHDVKWGIGTMVADAVTELRDVVLDFTQLKPVTVGAMVTAVPGIVPVTVAADSRVGVADAAFDFAYCTAALRLPRGFLSPAPYLLTGPYRYRGSENVYIGHGIEWAFAFSGGRHVVVQSRENAADPGRDYPLGDVNAETLKLELSVTCLSKSDAHLPPIKHGEEIEDFRAYWPLLSPIGSKEPVPTEVPVYLGGAPFAKTKALRGTVWRPCPPVMGS